MKYEIRVSYLVEAMIRTNRYIQYYLDKKLYQIFSYYEDEVNYQDELVLTPVYDVDEVLHRSVKLPSVNEINEKGVLKDFINTLDDHEARQILLESLNQGATLNQMIRYLYNLDIEKQYIAYRFEVFKEKAIAWAEINGIDYIIDK